MKDITAITILENMSMWSMLNADEYHAIKMGIEALREKEKREKREKDIMSDYPDMPYQFDNMTGSMNL